ncbi:hypothetical protein ABTM07_19380, partial [Acinetobacter baumannii]
MEHLTHRIVDAATRGAAEKTVSLFLGDRQSFWVGPEVFLRLSATRESVVAALRWLDFDRRDFMAGRGRAARTSGRIESLRRHLR